MNTQIEKTLIGYLVDSSGSMNSIKNLGKLAEEATKTAKDQIKDGREVFVTMASFDNRFELVKRHVNANEFVLTERDIVPRGGTALAPSIGRMVNLLEADIESMDVKPTTVMIVLLSDGDANTYSLTNREVADLPYEGEDGHIAVCELINRKETDDQWKFFWMGTNFDVLKSGPKFGFSQQTCVSFEYSTGGGSAALRSTSQAMSRFQDTSQGSGRSEQFQGYTESERQSSHNADLDTVESESPNVESSDGTSNPSAVTFQTRATANRTDGNRGTMLRSRATADISAMTKQEVINGTIVDVLEECNDFSRVRQASMEGWIRSKYLSPVSTNHKSLHDISASTACTGSGSATPTGNTFAHRQSEQSPWESFTTEHSELVTKMMAIVDDGSLLLPGTPFVIHWGDMAKSKMMPHESTIIQVNKNTGYTRLVKRV